MDVVDFIAVVASTAIYTLIAVRVAIVLGRKKGKAGSVAANAIGGIIWPFLMLAFGFCVLVTGDPGIYGHPDH